MTPLPFEYPEWIIVTENGLELLPNTPLKIRKAFSAWFDIANRNADLNDEN